MALGRRRKGLMADPKAKLRAKASRKSYSAPPTTDAQPERSDLMFDPWLTSSHRAVTAIADNMMAGYDYFAPTRQRAMKARDRANLNAMLHSIVANLALAAVRGVEPPSFGVSLRTSKQPVTRYDRPAFSGLPKVLEVLVSGGSKFALKKSATKGTASAFAADASFGETLRRFKFGPEHFAQAEGQEAIWLSRTERDFIGKTIEREKINYADTPETAHYRAEMETINAALARADLHMEPDGGPLVLTAMRRLRRVFNLPPHVPANVERFDLGGRLYGGWWQNLEKRRRAAIRIEGEPVADLDFSNMFLRLAFLEAGLEPPEGDLYAIPWLPERRHRKGVKMFMLAMLFLRTPLVRTPKAAKDLLPDATGADVRGAIRAAYPALASVFETGIGWRLMFLESQILVAALLDLAGQKVPALPMHDGIICQQSKAETVQRAMRDAAEQVVGFRLPVEPKPIEG